ncbi:MAG: GNAT family N-acetyltransferase [Cyanobacteria bacterium J06642_11]
MHTRRSIVQTTAVEVIMPTETTLQEIITLRAYCDEDWPAVRNIHDQARPYELEGSCNPNAFIPLADDPGDLETFHGAEKFVACIGRQIVGFVGIDDTFLSWLYVDPDYFGYGIGRELLNLALDLTGPRGWTVVLDGNIRARKLYENAGFQIIHTFASTNAGYPCNCLELALNPQLHQQPQPNIQAA